MEFTLLFKGDTPSIYERAAKKKKLIEKKKKENFYLPWVVHQAILPNAHISYRDYYPLSWLWYPHSTLMVVFPYFF